MTLQYRRQKRPKSCVQHVYIFQGTTGQMFSRPANPPGLVYQDTHMLAKVQKHYSCVLQFDIQTKEFPYKGLTTSAIR